MTQLPPVGAGPARADSPATRLFILSFAALFLELMVIRWVPSEIRLVAYYANLMLVSSFLGLGLGAILSAREWNLFRLFPALLMLNIVLLVGFGSLVLPGSASEFRFGAMETRAISYLGLIFLFLVNAAVFVPLGEQIGLQFQRVPPLRAYVWDLCGSLAGTLAFGLFSFLAFSPVLGIALVMALVFFVRLPGRLPAMLGCFAVALVAVFWSTQRERVWWSPYHFITVRENRLEIVTPAGPGSPGVARMAEHAAGVPPADLRTRRDPPIYTVRVNQDFYQLHGTIDLARYMPGRPDLEVARGHLARYDLPYHVVARPARVLVLGAGGGMDVEAALLRGAQRVDAVEIDPVIPKLSAQFSAADPYAQPNVVLHVDDARAFLQRSTARFDLVVFGHLDSQALFSYGASLRLDGYTYTVEGFRQAFARVAPDGAMAVSFVVPGEWLAQKFSQMIEEATGVPPLAYVGEGTVTFIATKQSALQPPATIGGWKLRHIAKQPVDLATDDWPYVYLRRRGIPADYAIVIGVLLTISVGALLAFRRAGFGAGDSHFVFLGWGFLLLQTKSIGDCSLYFGTTWLVTTFVIAGVLLMVLLANEVSLHFVRGFRPWFYAPLFVSLAIVLGCPRSAILAQDLGWRIAWTILIVPLPIFFAGLVFSSTFRETRQPALALGANLIGATLGGFCEYLGMWIGSQALGYLIIAAYAASLLGVMRSQRAPGAAPAIPSSKSLSPVG